MFFLNKFLNWTRCLFVLAVFGVIVSAQAETFPVTFEHKFGTTTIATQPQRVASLDWTGADDLLVLGVQPVAVRKWLCPEHLVCPWAEDLLSSTPVVIGRQIDYEALALTKPDVIIALWSGISAQEYAQLSKIAPVVATPKGVGDYGLSWHERALLTARAVGKETLGKAQVSKVKKQLLAAAKPQWQGKTAAIGFLTSESFGAIANNDPSMQILRHLGFVLPNSLRKDASRVDYLPLSAEEIQRLDADILLWVNTDNNERIEKLPGRSLLKAHREGRELMLDKTLSDALRQATVLSIPYAVEKLVPAIDGVLSDR